MEIILGLAVAGWIIWSTLGGLFDMLEEGTEGIAEDNDNEQN